MLTMYLKEHSEFFAPQSQFSSLAATPADAEIAAGTLILAHMGQIVSVTGYYRMYTHLKNTATELRSTTRTPFVL